MQLTVLKPADGSLGVSFREEAGKLRVSGVDEGSAGAAGGLKVDDVVSSFNGKRVGNLAAINKGGRQRVKAAKGEIRSSRRFTLFTRLARLTMLQCTVSVYVYAVYAFSSPGPNHPLNIDQQQQH